MSDRLRDLRVTLVLAVLMWTALIVGVWALPAALALHDRQELPVRGTADRRQVDLFQDDVERHVVAPAIVSLLLSHAPQCVGAAVLLPHELFGESSRKQGGPAWR
jgi:hypothetical protein